MWDNRRINERLDQMEQRLSSMETMLEELLKLARLNWMYKSQEEKDKVIEALKERYKDPEYFTGGIWEPENAPDTYEKPKADPDEGKDAYERLLEVANAEVKKGEMEGEVVPQKGRKGSRKTRKG